MTTTRYPFQQPRLIIRHRCMAMQAIPNIANIHHTAETLDTIVTSVWNGICSYISTNQSIAFGSADSDC